MSENYLEKYNKNSLDQSLDIDSKIKIINGLESIDNDFINKFIKDLIFLVKNFDDKDLISETFKDKEKSIFNPYDASCEALVDNIKKSKAIAIIINEINKVLPNQITKYRMHILMKLNNELGERFSVSFDENGKIIMMSEATHYKQQELEENRQNFLDSLK